MFKMHPICIRCSVAYSVAQVGVTVIELDNDGNQWRAFQADVKHCSGCGEKILEGFGGDAVYKDSQPELFEAMRKSAISKGEHFIFALQQHPTLQHGRYLIDVTSERVADGSGVLEYEARFAKDFDAEGLPLRDRPVGRGESRFAAMQQLMQEADRYAAAHEAKL